MKNFIKLFEDLNTNERESLLEFKEYGFIIDYSLDSTGHLYKCIFKLPVYAIELTEYIKDKYMINSELNINKEHIVNRGLIDYSLISNSIWNKINRNIDYALDLSIKYLKDNISNIEKKNNFKFVKSTNTELEIRKKNYEISGEINHMW